MNILAIDLGKYNSMCCFFDTCSREYKFCNTQTTRGYLEKFLAGRQIDLVVMEACGPSGWVSELCQQLGYPTLVCSTNEEAWRWKNVKRKTDKDDALKLARMAMMGQLTSVHVPKHEIREHRTLVKYRKTLDRRINQIKNSIRSLFSNRGIGIASGARAWHTGRERIDSFRKSLAECSMNELWRGQLNEELKQLDALTAQLANVEARLEVIAKSDPRIQRLQTIPGVGRKTAEALVTTLDDVHRFKNSRQVS
ncbi:MAG: IS110 family transposase, partial [Planctomycetota bacterium]